MGLTPHETPPVRELIDRSRVLVNAILERPDEAGPNFVMLLILADQLQMLENSFEDEEVRQLRDDKSS
ncbi:hypothetical protein IV431_20160 [Rahnella victoriana]|uniref:Prophage protein n=1 Tax=Rahnella victoriana TaxID=1510570 RepID=A0ABS0DVF4_9GAMM|nr:hypothetical protein [Rahnella victoriana]